MLFKVTKAAAKQIRLSSEQTGTEGMPLRVAASKNADGSIVYKMGFDDFAAGDVHVPCGSVDIVVAQQYQELLDGTTLDYVEIEPDKLRFIFLNPNDANYSPPDADDTSSAPRDQ